MNVDNLCKEYQFNNLDEVKEVIQAAWTKKLFAVRPQVFVLIRALGVARTFLATNDLNEVIKWARE